jgi:integrase
MGLFKRNNVWWMSFTSQGKQIRESTEVTSKGIAEKIYFKAMTQIAEGKWLEKLPGEDKTFSELMAKYLKEYSATNKAKTSQVRDIGIAVHLNKFFGAYKLNQISPRLISEYKTKRRKDEAAPKTINNELVLMGHCFNISMKEWEWTKENPVSRVSKEKVYNQIERWLTFEEESRLLLPSPEWLREIIIFAINTGLRQSEILNLQWAQVDLFRKTITLLVQKNKNKDTLPLNQAALEVLKGRAKVRHIKSEQVFFNPEGKPVNVWTLISAFRSSIKKEGLSHLQFHDLRHTFATRLVQAGVDIYTVQKLGRWKTISMVMRYAHHYPESLRSGIETLDRAREKFYHNFITIGGSAPGSDNVTR